MQAFSYQQTLHQAATSEVDTLHQVKHTHYTKWSEYVDPLELQENLIPGNDFHSMGTGDVTLAYDDAAKGSLVLGMKHYLMMMPPKGL